MAHQFCLCFAGWSAFFIVLRSFAIIIHHIRKNHRTFRRNSATKTDSYEFIAGYHTQTSIIHDYACKCYVSYSQMKIHSFIAFSSWHSLKSITTLRANNKFFSDFEFFCVVKNSLMTKKSFTPCSYSLNSEKETSE